MKRDAVWLLLFTGSIGLILYFTIFTRDIGAMRIFKGPFWELRSRMWKDIFLNMLLFLPFGFFAGRFWGWKSVLFGFLLSVAIETIQYVGALGYTEVDDVINNTIGTFLGVAMAQAFKMNTKHYIDLPRNRHHRE